MGEEDMRENNERGDGERTRDKERKQRGDEMRLKNK